MNRDIEDCAKMLAESLGHDWSEIVAERNSIPRIYFENLAKVAMRFTLTREVSAKAMKAFGGFPIDEPAYRRSIDAMRRAQLVELGIREEG